MYALRPGLPGEIIPVLGGLKRGRQKGLICCAKSNKIYLKRDAKMRSKSFKILSGGGLGRGPLSRASIWATYTPQAG